MSVSNRDRIEQTLNLLREGLAPYVEREIENALTQNRLAPERLETFRSDAMFRDKPVSAWDAHALLKLMHEVWQEVFQGSLSYIGRSMVNELREWRNRWAHQATFSSDDTLRVLDTAERLLNMVSAADAAEKIRQMKQELQRQIYEDQRRYQARKKPQGLDLESPAGLKPWREVITPHEDVISRRFQQAEFAADLWQVFKGEGSDEYRDPREFFRRTHLTDSLRQLLINAARRLAGRGGDPVIQLQTNFGGGKTHSLLALYHMFDPNARNRLPGLDDLLREAGAFPEQPVRRVVIVGNRISPGSPDRKPDGTETRTLWGEIAWQLGGADAYSRVAEDDRRATNPGDKLRDLLEQYGPCLILIDEWVAYARQLHDQSDLPGGSFETQITFVQTLTESARQIPNCLLVISLPASQSSGSPHTWTQTDEMEIGGAQGAKALNQMKHIIGRIESFWRPASMEESFQIVRKRLFNELSADNAPIRDHTAREFAKYYQENRADFPGECAEADYEEKIRQSYPIHPEVFERLYTDWAALPRFQRTRGVLRLMAEVVHALWESEDKTPLILPCSLPIDRQEVQSELHRHLEDRWDTVLDTDVDGPNSISRQLDKERSNFGKIHATLRVARTVFFGSAPTRDSAHRGIDRSRILLGCAMPGDPLPFFSDALRALAEKAHHLYTDDTRYWFDTRPTLLRIAQDKAEALRREPDRIYMAIEDKLRATCREVRMPDIEVVCCPRDSSEIADTRNVRIVALDPKDSYQRGREDCPAMNRARQILETRGSSQRIFRNTLAFLAPDENRLQDLMEAVRYYLAWQAIDSEKETRELTKAQVRQIEEQLKENERKIQAQIAETYTWLLTPEQVDPTCPNVIFSPAQLRQNDHIVKRVVQKLREDGQLVRELSASTLREKLDTIPLWRGNHVAIRQLLDDFASYLYLYRLASPRVLLKACEDGVASLTWEQDGFACADSWDETEQRYRNLRVAVQVNFTEDTPCLLVKPEVALKQLQEEADEKIRRLGQDGNQDNDKKVKEPTKTIGGSTGTITPPPVSPPVYRKFYGSCEIDPLKVARQIQNIDNEVLMHLKNAGATLRITIEIQAELPEGLDPDKVRVIRENSRSLGFQTSEFE